MEEARGLMLLLWDIAVKQPRYDKKRWQQLQQHFDLLVQITGDLTQ